MYIIQETTSSLIKSVEYDEECLELTVYFKKYYTDQLTYCDVPLNYFIQMSEEKSLGKFYLSMIQKFFKLKPSKMAEKPKTVNYAKDDYRYIDMSINLREVNKDWIFPGEKGDWLHLTLRMLPNGDVDDYGNLGFIAQKVPKKIFEEDKKKPKNEKRKGAILGNACEFERKSAEGSPGDESGQTLGEMKAAGKKDIADDLPF